MCNFGTAAADAARSLRKICSSIEAWKVHSGEPCRIRRIAHLERRPKMPELPLALIADDDEEHREQLSLALEALGLRTAGVAGGQPGLDWLAEGGRADLIALDVARHELDGVETLLRYRSGGGRAPVIICSEVEEADTVVRAMRAGATDYITK